MKKNFYLSIISYIKENKKLPDLNLSKQAMNYYVKQLKHSQIIYKIGYGVWEVNQDKWEQFQFRKQVKITPKVAHPTEIEKLTEKRNIRGHGFVFKLKVKHIQNWIHREKYLLKHDIEYKKIGLYKNTHSITFRNNKIWLCNNSIIIYYPKDKSFFDITAEDSKQYAIYNLEHLIIGLERLLSIDLKIMGKYEFKTSRQHYANINNSLARQYNKDGKKLNIYNKDGLWFVIDNSFNLDEAETTNAKTSDKDMDHVVMPFFNDLKDHYDKTGESLTIGKMMELMNSMIKLNMQQTIMQNPVQPKPLNNKELKIKDKFDYIG